MEFRTPLARVMGLGSAKSGTLHWWMQRVSAVALIPLSFIAIAFLNACLTVSYEQIVTWLSLPFNAACLIAWTLAAFYHAALGLQVVIEDYVAHEGSKIIAVWTVKLVFAFFALLAVLAILRIAIA